ncbi:MAG TPA: energy transducer TonB [Polyangiaceae bacterium]|nr:energy transducer TonB [Polyangiaceae bacterium]
MARKKKKLSTVYVVSIGAHLLVGAILALVPQDKLREVVAIALNEAPKQEKKAEPPKPQPHPAERPSHAPGHTARNTPAPAAAAAADPVAGFQDIGLALDSSSSEGIAVAIAPAQQQVAAPVAAPPPKPKVLVAHATENTCTEDIVKARPLTMVRPAYTDAARRAKVEGRVRLELTVNERGEVTGARVLSGLGYGLDEAAIAAAQRLHFRPATRCKQAVAAPFILAMRFVLGS